MQAPQMLELAREVGYGSIGVRLSPPGPGESTQLLDSPALQRETVSRIKTTGIQIFDIEVIRIGAEFEVKDQRKFLDVAAMLGASVVLVIGGDSDAPRLTERFAALCEMAASYGLDLQLEFMPWTAVRNARDAARIVNSAGCPNGKVLVDVLHVARSDTSLDDLSAIPPHRMISAQVCDGRHSGVMSPQASMAARFQRLLPGEGDVDIAGIVSRLPGDLRIGVEVPNAARMAAVGPAAWAKQALIASQLVIDQIR